MIKLSDYICNYLTEIGVREIFMIYGSARKPLGRFGEEVAVMKKFWKNKIVLVTGFEGFLGSWLF